MRLSWNLWTCTSCQALSELSGLNKRSPCHGGEGVASCRPRCPHENVYACFWEGGALCRRPPDASATPRRRLPNANKIFAGV